jgi:hypothetical protein
VWRYGDAGSGWTKGLRRGIYTGSPYMAIAVA